VLFFVSGIPWLLADLILKCSVNQELAQGFVGPYSFFPVVLESLNANLVEADEVRPYNLDELILEQ
jgi:hypothetical protein